jgi:hypothetical protein
MRAKQVAKIQEIALPEISGGTYMLHTNQKTYKLNVIK